VSANTQTLTKEDLSQSDLRLIEIMSRVHYGTIDSFPVQNGQPMLDPEPEIELCEKIGMEIGQKPSIWNGKYLHPRFSDAIRLIRGMHNGRVTRIEIQEGLPFKIAKRPGSCR